MTLTAEASDDRRTVRGRLDIDAVRVQDAGLYCCSMADDDDDDDDDDDIDDVEPPDRGRATARPPRLQHCARLNVYGADRQFLVRDSHFC